MERIILVKRGTTVFSIVWTRSTGGSIKKGNTSRGWTRVWGEQARDTGGDAIKKQGTLGDVTMTILDSGKACEALTSPTRLILLSFPNFSIQVNRVLTYRDLDNDLMKYAAFQTLVSTVQ